MQNISYLDLSSQTSFLQWEGTVTSPFCQEKTHESSCFHLQLTLAEEMRWTDRVRTKATTTPPPKTAILTLELECCMARAGHVASAYSILVLREQDFWDTNSGGGPLARLRLWKIVQSSHHAQDSQCCDMIFCSTTQSCHGDAAHHQTIPVKPVLGLPSKLKDYMLLAPFLCKISSLTWFIIEMKNRLMSQQKGFWLVVFLW